MAAATSPTDWPTNEVSIRFATINAIECVNALASSMSVHRLIDQRCKGGFHEVFRHELRVEFDLAGIEDRE